MTDAHARVPESCFVASGRMVLKHVMWLRGWSHILAQVGTIMAIWLL